MAPKTIFAQHPEYPFWPWIIRYEAQGNSAYAFPAGGWGPNPWPTGPEFDTGFGTYVMGGRDAWGPGGYTGQVLQTAEWPSEIGGSEKKWYYVINFTALPS